MTYSDGYYYLMTTTWTNLQITRATTLEGLKNGETRVVWTDANPTRCCNVWAPELHKIDNTYVTPLDLRCDILLWPWFVVNANLTGGTSTTRPATAKTWMASVPMS